MNRTPIISLILGSVLSLVTLASAQVPQMINYQGRVAVGDPAVNFDGTGEFKFALVNEDGSASYWSNDGTSTEGSEPTAAVSLMVTNGLYSVLLGDPCAGCLQVRLQWIGINTNVSLGYEWTGCGGTTLDSSSILGPNSVSTICIDCDTQITFNTTPFTITTAISTINQNGNVVYQGQTLEWQVVGVCGPEDTVAIMTAIPNSVFGNSDVHLRVWFDDGTNGSQLLTPDQRIAAVGYAMVASTVVDGAITSEKLASGLVLGGTTSGTFSGDGSGLTNIPASAMASAESPETVFPASGMVWIKPGKFLMGSRTDEVARDNDETQHWVTLTQGFWMSSHEVTQAEYQNVIGINPSSFTGDTNRPVETVSWNEAVDYCTALTNAERNANRIPSDWEYHLPTEAEWEYCARAGANARYGHGDDLGYTALGNYAWYADNSGDTTHPVEQKLANAWGLFDMHGNVYEWCHDRSADYPAGSAIDPQGSTTSNQRIYRGGTWKYQAWICRAANRLEYPPTLKYDYLGFRVSLGPAR